MCSQSVACPEGITEPISQAGLVLVYCCSVRLATGLDVVAFSWCAAGEPTATFDQVNGY